jgi:hypothetical protein
MVISPVGLGTKNNSAGEDQQQFSSQSLYKWALVSSHMGLMTIFYCVTALGAFRLFSFWATPTPDLLNTNLLRALANRVILGFNSHETHDHILLSESCGSLQAPASFSWLTDCYIAGGPRQHSDTGSNSHETHDHILLSDVSGSLQTTATLRWPVGRLNCYWFSPTQSFLVSGLVEIYSRKFVVI